MSIIQREFSYKKNILPPPGPPLESFTWPQIDAIGRAGLASKYFSLQELKTFTVLGTTYQLELIAFDHDDLADGSGKAPYTFLMKDCLIDMYAMNPTRTNVGGYSGSEIYSTLNNNIYPTINADVRAVIKPIIKKTSEGNVSPIIVSTEELIFMVSEFELRGTTSNSFAGEGEHYAIFNTNASRIKRRPQGPVLWYQRSPATGNAVRFCSTTVGGGFSTTNANALSGICFGLCV